MAFAVRRGLNVSHWMSEQRAGGAPAEKTAAEARAIADEGFDHVRVPLFERGLWTEDLVRENASFDLLGRNVEGCLAAGLSVVVDMHVLRSHFFNDPVEPRLFSDDGEVERFVAIWTDLSKFLRGFSVDKVAYEMLNEPVSRDPDGAGWNRVSRRVFAALRALEPERSIVLGSNWYSNHEMYRWLEVPKDDRLLLTFHYYRPLLVTHYRAEWTEQASYKGPVHYPGTSIDDAHWPELGEKARAENAKFNVPYDREAMKRDLSLPVSVAKREGRPIFCSEFGCITYVPPAIRLRWYTDFLSVLGELGVPWTHWDYRSSHFGMYSADGVRTPIADLLTAPSPSG